MAHGHRLIVRYLSAEDESVLFFGITKRANWATLSVLLTLALMLYSATAMAQPEDNDLVVEGSELTPVDEIPPGMVERGVIRLDILQVPVDFFVQPPDPGVSEPVVIWIDSDRTVSLVETARREVGDKVYVLGEVADSPHSRFSMVLQDGMVDRGEIRLHNEAIFITTTEVSASSMQMQMITVDPSLLPQEREPSERNLPGAGPDVVPPPEGGGPDEDEDDPTVVKILVVYTEAARIALNIFFTGTRTIEEVIEDSVFLSNFSFALHGEFVLELVHMEEVNYKETGDIIKDRNRLACPCDHKFKGIGDNHLNEVFEPWKTFEADIVSLWLNYVGDSGIAFIMSDVTTNFAPYAVSVVDWGAAFFNYSFEHEIGHNFGARHHREHDPDDGLPYMFNHGGWNQPAQMVTIMTYRSVCQFGVDCDRVAVWSNPDYPPIGAWGLATGVDAADNARALRESKGTISQLHEQGSDLVGCCVNVGNWINQKWQPGECP